MEQPSPTTNERVAEPLCPAPLEVAATYAKLCIGIATTTVFILTVEHKGNGDDPDAQQVREDADRIDSQLEAAGVPEAEREKVRKGVLSSERAIRESRWKR